MKQIYHLLVIAFMLAVALSIPAHAQNAEETLQLADQYIVLKKQNEKLKQEVLDREQELAALQNKEKELKAKLEYYKKNEKNLIPAIKAEKEEIGRKMQEVAEKNAALKQENINLRSKAGKNNNLLNKITNDTHDNLIEMADALIEAKYAERTINGFLKYLEQNNPTFQSRSTTKLRLYKAYNSALISLFDGTFRDICNTTKWDMAKAIPLIQVALENNEYYNTCYKQDDKSIPYLDRTIDDFKEIIQYGVMSEELINIFVNQLK